MTVPAPFLKVPVLAPPYVLPRMALKKPFRTSQGIKVLRSQNASTSSRFLVHRDQSVCCRSICASNSAAGPLEGPHNSRVDQAVNIVRDFWEKCPQSVKIFPWKGFCENYLQIIVGLAYGVAKWLCLPVFAISCLSEMSYCAHERRMKLIPIPMLVGWIFASMITDFMVEFSQDIRDYPWYLLVVAILFTLLKLPGPYYPYWGCILIPHIANGGLLRTLWFLYKWYRVPSVAWRAKRDTSLADEQTS